MDFISVWKAVSVGLTGALGVIALVTNTNEPESKKLTRWGIINLVGILVSAGLGIAAQILETSRSSAEAAVTSKKQTEMILNIQRILTPINPAHFMLSFTGSCRDLWVTQFCSNLRAAHWDPRVTSDAIWNHWPKGGHVMLPLHAYFFRSNDEISAQAIRDSAAAAQYELFSTNYAKDKSLMVSFDAKHDELEFSGQLPAIRRQQFEGHE